MTRTKVVFLLLAGCHLGLLLTARAGVELLAPAAAATVYAPLVLLHWAGLGVFGIAQSGGWAAPSLLGWVLVVAFWGLLWWAVAALSRLLPSARA